MDFTAFWTGVSAVGALAAAAVAAVAARQSSKSAGEANAAAKALADIERERRHDELTPDFEVTCKVSDGDPDLATLRLELKPGRLEGLDAVTVTILDEAGRDHWGHGLPENVSQDRAERFVWGGWEFAAGTDATVSNREMKPRAYSLVSGKNWDVIPLSATRAGSWTSTTPDQWRKQYDGKPIRLLLTCRHGGDVWQVLCEVEPQKEKRGRVRVIE